MNLPGVLGDLLVRRAERQVRRRLVGVSRDQKLAESERSIGATWGPLRI
jgi:hypothetical protein